MSISKLTANVSVHQSMEDEPNDVGGLTAAELKAAWDAPANAIKDYVNDSLIPELDAAHLPYQYGTEGGQTVKQAVEQAVLGTVPDGSVTTVKLADGAVTAGKIADGAVTLAKLPAGFFDAVAPWDLLQSYTAAGTYTWTAPDLYGNGQPYKIGVYMLGGGGAGGSRYGGGPYMWATGGASGYGRNLVMTVEPGNNYAIVVGAGGAEIVNGGTTGIGGTTAFFGKTAFGGNSGIASYGDNTNYLARGADGGQGSDAAVTSNYTGAAANAPAMGAQTNGCSASTYYPGGSCYFPGIVNLLDGSRHCAAGGGAARIGNDTSIYTQGRGTLDDGTYGGAGAAASYASGLSVTAESATGNGNGGGGAVGSTSPVTSGAGSDGAVWIYARRLET